jgi:glycosyltransferase involved in cell wall biosynthesis
MLNGQGLARAAVALKKGGFTPDIVVAHSGWGSGSFAKAVWPQTRLVQYLEWWYNWPAPDVSSAEPEGSSEDEVARTLSRNLPFLLDFQQADLVLFPTKFQARQAPAFVRQNAVVQHDGVDCDAFAPSTPGDKIFAFPGLPDDAPIATFATRGMEPIRGFPTFMEAASRLQQTHPDVHIVVAGGETVHYGKPPQGAKSWKQHALDTHDFEPQRLHFAGLLPKSVYRQLLQRTRAHAYLTRPFVLSWSLIEAAATACPLVVSDVAPVREALPDDDLARRVPLDDPKALHDALAWCLDNPEQGRAMGLRARQAVKTGYHKTDCHVALEALFLDVIDGRLRQPALSSEMHALLDEENWNDPSSMPQTPHLVAKNSPS